MHPYKSYIFILLSCMMLSSYAQMKTENIEQRYANLTKRMSTLASSETASFAPQRYSPKHYAASKAAWEKLQKQYERFNKSKQGAKDTKQISKHLDKLEFNLSQVNRIKVLNQTYFGYALSQLKLLDQLVTSKHQRAYDKALKQLYRSFAKIEKNNSIDGLAKAKSKIQKKLNLLESKMLVTRLVEPRKLALLQLNPKLIPIHYGDSVEALNTLEKALNDDPKAVSLIAKLIDRVKFSIAKAVAIESEVLKIKSVPKKQLETLAADYHQSLNSLADVLQVKRNEDMNYEQRIQSFKEQLQSQATLKQALVLPPQ